MPARRKSHVPTKLIQEWPLPPAVTLGSSVRARGILLEVRAHLPPTAKKLIEIDARSLVLRVPIDDENVYDELCVRVSKLLEGIESLPVIPREAEDILTMSTAERHRWLKDGRLQSAGTRTVKLRGRARQITFHIFDTRHIEDVLDRDLQTIWREEDAMTSAENRRRAAGKAALTRARRNQPGGTGAAMDEASTGDAHPKLEGWEDFYVDGLLR